MYKQWINVMVVGRRERATSKDNTNKLAQMGLTHTQEKLLNIRGFRDRRREL